MRFVDDDREVFPGSFAFHFIQNERELLHRGDDDLPSLRDEAPQVARLLGMAYGSADLHELFHRLLELVV